MKLLVIVLCLLSERFLIHSASYQRFYWFNNYCSSMMNVIEKNNGLENPWLVLMALLLPIIIPVGIIYLLSLHLFWGFISLIFSIVMFLYCLGPQNPFYPLSERNNEESNNKVIANYFALVNRQLFSAIFCYVIAGPIAVLTYRLITLCQEITSVREQANRITDIIEWIPARITAMLFLLVGNFQRGFVLFSNLFFSKPEKNNQMLSDCGMQAVRSNEEEVPLTMAETMVEHAAIILLVLIALLTLVAWL